MPVTIGHMEVKVGADTKQLRDGMKKATGYVADLDTGMKKAAGGGTLLKGGLLAAAAAAGVAVVAFKSFKVVGRVMSEAVAAAADMEESQNLLRETFKASSGDIIAWAATTAEATGRSKFEIQDMAARMQSLLAPMASSREEATKMSKDMTQLSVDLASFFNTTDTQALDDLRSGLSGQLEPLRKYGIVMTQAQLGAFAMSKGIDKSIKSMSESEKVALRYQFIMSQTSDAQGDAARTAPSYTNQVKRLRAVLKDLRIEFGQSFLPVFKVVVKNMAGFFEGIRTNMPALGPAARKVFGTMAAAAAAVGLAVIELAQVFSKILGPIIDFQLGNIELLAKAAKGVADFFGGSDMLDGVTAGIAGAREGIKKFRSELEGGAFIGNVKQTLEDMGEGFLIAADGANEAAEGVKDVNKETQKLVGTVNEAVTSEWLDDLFKDDAVDALQDRVAKIIEEGKKAQQEAMKAARDQAMETARAVEALRMEFARLFGQIVNDGMSAKEIFQELLVVAGSFFGQKFGGPAGGAAGGSLGRLVGSIFHEGSDGPIQSGQLLTLPGMKPDEGLAMLQTGEEVVPRGGSAGGSGIQVNINPGVPAMRTEIDKMVRNDIIPALLRMKMMKLLGG